MIIVGVAAGAVMRVEKKLRENPSVHPRPNR